MRHAQNSRVQNSRVQSTRAQDGRALLACVILAHTDPQHVQRLVRALDPFPVFLHCDPSTPDDAFAEMTRGLAERAVVMPRIKTGWARWENVEAELQGYRAALATTDATHVAVLTGTDYPLASSDEISELLGEHAGTSFALIDPLPHPEWGRSGGFDRLRYRHWAWRKRMIRLPIPRRLPHGVTFAGGSQLKVLSREHAQAVLDAVDAHPELVGFWKRSWVADETFVPSILMTERFVPDWEQKHVRATLWWIGWDGTRRKSPPWLTHEHAERVLSRRSDAQQELPHFFARKFSTAESTPLLDALDAEHVRAGTPGRSAAPAAQDGTP
ncbi:core-2/I-Branching enzyme [Frondihabitans sp. PhB188]|nr:core-2/I-Branching enzyme [Frondihabitans sp. PhB188]